jgi:predicted DNA-binding transcriptional regulator AlpA
METTRAFMTEAELAEFLGRPKCSVTSLRKNGTGPAWFRIGVRMVGYRLSDVDDWLATRKHAPFTTAPPTVRSARAAPDTGWSPASPAALPA